MPIDRERPYLLRAVIETKQPLVIEHVTPEQLESVAQGPEHLQALRAVDPTSIMALPLLRHGQLLGVLAFVSSGSRHYGRSDLRLAEALADRAAVAIENARLYNASVEAAQIRDQVLGFVAHDLRNPLGAITMQAGLLQRRGAEPERRSRKPAETIQRAATRMNRLIQDILDVSRMEGGHLSVEQARVPTEQIVSDSVEAQTPLASSASIDLQLDLETGVSDVWADRDRVLQVFENLIGNAVKFTRPGGRITAGAASHDGEVVFWVKDTGAGISAEELPHVFDRFWQARKARRAGAGLGLQIVKGIVEAHGGRIWVESEVGSGHDVLLHAPNGADRGRAASCSEHALSASKLTPMTTRALSSIQAEEYLAPFKEEFQRKGKRIGMDVDAAVLTYGHGGNGAVVFPGVHCEFAELADARGSTFVDGDLVVDGWVENVDGLVFVRGNLIAHSLYNRGYLVVAGELRVTRFFGEDERYGTYVFGDAAVAQAVFAAQPSLRRLGRLSGRQRSLR